MQNKDNKNYTNYGSISSTSSDNASFTNKIAEQLNKLSEATAPTRSSITETAAKVSTTVSTSISALFSNAKEKLSSLTGTGDYQKLDGNEKLRK